MKNPITLAIEIALVSIFSISCQTSQTAETKRAKGSPTPAVALPAWTKSSSQGVSDQQILITTKFVEITRPASESAPSKPYTKKLSDPDFQVYIRSLSQTKGADLMSAPSVVTREGQVAKIEIVKEFTYPLTPGENAKKASENTGVTSHFLARAGGEGKKIDLKALSDFVEFEGFSEVSPGFDQPVFDRRRVESSAELTDGYTYVHGGFVTESEQEITDTTLGIFKKHRTEKFTRELIVFIRPQFIDPAGRPVASTR